MTTTRGKTGIVSSHVGLILLLVCVFIAGTAFAAIVVLGPATTHTMTISEWYVTLSNSPTNDTQVGTFFFTNATAHSTYPSGSAAITGFVAITITANCTNLMGLTLEVYYNATVGWLPYHQQVVGNSCSFYTYLVPAHSLSGGQSATWNLRLMWLSTPVTA